MKSKKTISFTTVAIIAIIVLSLGIITLVLTTNVLFDKFAFGKGKTTSIVSKMGKTFYEDFYYNLLTAGKSESEISDTLQGQEFTITVEQIRKVSEIEVNDLFVSLGNDSKKYDWSFTDVTIIPQAPYGKTDYSISVTLVVAEN